MTAPDDVLTPAAVEFLHLLQRELGSGREEILAARAARAQRLRDGELPDFLEETRSVREGDWRVPPAPADLADRRVEITGPTDRKMVINALNCGAKVFMTDFEDANSPTWENMIDGQRNLSDAIDRTIRLEQNDKVYELNDEVATLLVRPRGWHMLERHFEVDGAPMSASLFDFGLYLFRNHERLNGTGYPRALAAAQISLPGQMVACAELLAGLLHKPNALQRADLAMKIVGGEHPRSVAGLVAATARTLRPDAYEIDYSTIDRDEVLRLSQRLASAGSVTFEKSLTALLKPIN